MRALLVVLLLWTSSFASEPRQLSLGSISQNPKRFQIYATFGIEQWEQGRRASFRDQLWQLICSSPPYVPTELTTECRLERTVIHYLTLDRRRRGFVAVHSHSIQDGTLELLYADWPTGKLDFNVIHTDGSRIEVKLRLKYRENTIYLDSFQAFGIARSVLSDSLGAIEYRIPQYTRTVEVPIELPGYGTEKDKLLDEIVASLSKHDRAIWQASGGRILSTAWSLQKVVPDVADIDKGKRKLTTEDVTRIKRHFCARFDDEAKRSGMSAFAIDRLRAFYAELLLGSFSEGDADFDESGTAN